MGLRPKSQSKEEESEGAVIGRPEKAEEEGWGWGLEPQGRREGLGVGAGWARPGLY